MKRIFSLALVLLVGAVALSTGAGTGTVAAADDTNTTETCGIDTWQSQMGHYDTIDAYLAWNPTPSVEIRTTNCEALQDDLGYYQDATETAEMYESWANTYDNSLPSMKGRAFQKLEQTTLYEYDNGTSLSSAKISAKDSWSAFYSKKQANALETWEAMAHTFDTRDNQSTYDLFTVGSTFSKDMDPNSAMTTSGWDVHYNGLTTKNFTLVNGTTREVTALSIKYEVITDVSGTRTTYAEVVPYNGKVTATYSHDGNTWTFTSNTLAVNPPPGTDYPIKGFMIFNVWENRFNQLDNEYSAFNNDSNTYVEAIYNGLDTGKISYQDAISRVTKIDNYLQQTASSNSSFSMTSVALASMGYDGVDVYNTSYMTVSMQTDQYNMTIKRDGMLLSYGTPVDGWEYNRTYNSSKLDGSQMFVDLDGEEYTITGNFTVLGAWDGDGDSINDSDIENPDKDRINTYNASDYINLTRQLSGDINAIEEELNDDSRGGAGSGIDASGFFSAFGNALTGLFGFVGSGLTGAIQGLVIVAGGLIALSILLNALMPG